MTILVLTGLAEEARVITERDDVRVLTGVKALVELDQQPADVEAAVSWGTAGALTPYLGVGDVVILDSVIFDDESTELADRAWNLRLAKAYTAVRRVRGYSGPKEIAVDAASKGALAFKTHALTVDMGAYAVAQFAAKRGIPWVAVQGISDAWNQEIPSVASMSSTAGTSDGAPDVGRVLAGLGAHPDEIRPLIKVAATFFQAILGLERAYDHFQPWLCWR